jgi:2-oxo-3-hexenedioate decarboxylase
MAGGATPAEPLAPGQFVSVEMERLGSASFHVQA